MLNLGYDTRNPREWKDSTPGDIVCVRNQATLGIKESNTS